MPRLKDDERLLREAVAANPGDDPRDLAAMLNINVRRVGKLIRRLERPTNCRRRASQEPPPVSVPPALPGEECEDDIDTTLANEDDDEGIYRHQRPDVGD